MTFSRVKGLTLAVAALILSCGLLSVNSAKADARFCNKTSGPMMVAAKYPVGNMNALSWVTTGWFFLNSGDCTISFVSGDATNINFHFSAIRRDYNGNLAYVNLGADHPRHFSCVTVNDQMFFKIYGEYSVCPAGYYMAPFHKYTGYAYNMEFSITD